jgi:small subunit ribosomal protein YMR-31
MKATKTLRAAAAAQHRTPSIQFIGKRHAPGKFIYTYGVFTHTNILTEAGAADAQQPQAHPAAPTQSLPTTFKQYRVKATQHGPLHSAPAIGYIGASTGHALGDVAPPKGVAFDRDELPSRFARLAWTPEEIEAVESAGASAFA